MDVRQTRTRRTIPLRRTRLAAGVAALVSAAALTVAPAVPVAAEDPVLVPWTTLLPGVPGSYDPSSPDVCRSGSIKCVDEVIREMEARFKPLARGCDHDAIFSLIYLRTTEEYRRAVTTPGFFDDPGFLNHYDAVFALYYFQADSDWHGGRKDRVPPAWREAFDAAERKEVTGRGNLLLGMNAHIERDLPFVLADIGLVAPDGTSRKADHDKVNAFLNRVGDEELGELARRFDPTMDDGNVPGTTADSTASLQLVQEWREEAWRKAETLVRARQQGPAAYAAAAAAIEEEAAQQARNLLTATSYELPVNGSRPARDAYCAQHWSDR